jgi:malto-oligosyltrehalose synthase/4-alpha-glucanotransferase
MFNPVSTYRLQFHKEFSLKHLETIIPYLQALGIKTIYASPLFMAVPGSIHGYDGTAPDKFNPEITTAEQFRSVMEALHKNGISWIQDIVPNHMAYHCDNKWLMDVLEKGKESEFASFFDICWECDPESRLLAPFLNDELTNVIKKGELKLVHKGKQYCFAYADQHFPLNQKSIQIIREISDDSLFAVERINADTSLLFQLANMQFYKLCHWRTTDQQINYRRFFTVNGLICLNMQDNKVFESVHQLILELAGQSLVRGIRIDHIDGLADPERYLRKLRKIVGEDTFICIEKILQPDELLPLHWPIEGTTGYDFLGLVNNLFINTENEKKFIDFYLQLTGNNCTVKEQVAEKKAKILKEQMRGELDNLYELFVDLNRSHNEKLAAVPPDVMKSALAAFLIECPVYRYYGEIPLDPEETTAVSRLLIHIQNKYPDLTDAISILQQVFLKPENNRQQQVTSFYKRCMQFTGPLMAKGVEDTLMYTYNCFISHNDVGDSPEKFGITVSDFHKKIRIRQKYWPLTLNTTSTHDTKRGEDVRARLNVLTDLAEDWFEIVKKWMSFNAALKKNNIPDNNDEYFIYQTLVGSYPMPGEDAGDFQNRLNTYLVKALREAKVNSSWKNPNEQYENGTLDFISGLLNSTAPFWKSFEAFLSKIVDHGIVNALSQMILKHTCAGVPDTYQGTEFWDLSLVDPDNRRPVDFDRLNKCLNKIRLSKDQHKLLSELWNNRYQGSIKLYVLQSLLTERKQQPSVFEKGIYTPLTTTGKFSDQVVTFLRQYQQTYYLVAVPLRTATIAAEVQEMDWEDTEVVVPDELPLNWKNIFTGTTITRKIGLKLNDLFRSFPFALLKSQQLNERGAGVLLAVSALPTAFGIGDLGPAAKAFIDFLTRCCQKYWQLLPLNPIAEEYAYSPYSSSSAMAGNALLISPEVLVEEGLLDMEELHAFYLPLTGSVNYPESKHIKEKLLSIAYHRFFKGNFFRMQQAFEVFKKEESYWLTDYALFCILEDNHPDTPWYNWPEKYKYRDAAALEELKEEKKDSLDLVKWKQFIFHRQWRNIREYANGHGIKLFGDLPFYTSHNSCDVWANKEIFSINDDGAIEYSAGVPPDYFSNEGQLWGMPTFKWDVLKKNNYQWWINRFKKNLQLFDLLRIDHFRALAEYWEVPAGETTAINGKWKKGPGEQLFHALKNAFGNLPFVAEDLGDQMEAVYRLRKKINIPGMKVLQFAFGENMPHAVDVPHNFTPNCVVYTGTHDNNTTVGWYQEETTAEDRIRLEQYSNTVINEKNVSDVLSRMAYASVAKIVILPLQDIMGLDKQSRVNTPGRNEGNWLWQYNPALLTAAIEEKLRNWTRFYNRQ